MMRENSAEAEPILLGETVLIPIVRTRLIAAAGTLLATKTCIALLVRGPNGERRIDIL